MLAFGLGMHTRCPYQPEPIQTDGTPSTWIWINTEVQPAHVIIWQRMQVGVCATSQWQTTSAVPENKSCCACYMSTYSVILQKSCCMHVCLSSCWRRGVKIATAFVPRSRKNKCACVSYCLMLCLLVSFSYVPFIHSRPDILQDELMCMHFLYLS